MNDSEENFACFTKGLRVEHTVCLFAIYDQSSFTSELTL